MFLDARRKHVERPIVCQMNLDLVKKLMIKNGKLPADIESKFITPRDALPLNPIQERIIDYFKDNSSFVV